MSGIWERLTDWEKSPVLDTITKLRIWRKIGALRDENPDVRERAAWVLWKIGLPAVPAFVEALKDDKQDVRAMAVWTLKEIVRTHPEYAWGGVVPSFVEALKEENPNARWSAVWALGEIAEKHPEYAWGGVVPSFVEALKEENPNARWYAVRALAKIGPRDYGDLDLIVLIGGKLKKEGKEFKPVMELHSKWVEAMNRRANEIINDKSFHVPKIEKPDKMGRIMRVRRLSA